MKKILFLFLFILSLFAEDRKIKDFKNNIESSNDFIMAKVSYKNKDYKRSYNKLKKLFLLEPNNLQVNYYYAKSAIQLKKYDEAILAYKKVLLKKEDFIQVRLEYAVLLANSGEHEKAKIQLEKALTYDLSEDIRKKTEVLLKKIKRKNKDLFFASISLSYLHDNNINNVLEETKYNFKSKDDYGFTAFANLNYIKKLSNDSINLNNNILLFKKRTIRNNEYDIAYLAYKPSFKIKDLENKQSLNIGLGIEKLYTGNDSNFKTFLISSEYQKQIDKYLLSSKYSFNKSFYDREIDKDYDFVKNNIDFNIKIRKLAFYKIYFKDLNINSKYSIYRDINTSTKLNINKNTFELKTNLKYLLPYSSELFLEYKYKYSDYKDHNRSDNTNTYKLKVSKYLTKKDSINLSLINKRNKSNQTLYSYDKNLFNITYTRKLRW